MKVELIALSPEDGMDVFEMVKEIGIGENGFSNSLFTDDFIEFRTMLQQNFEKSLGINLPPQFVQQTICWLYVNEKPVGYGKLRHELNDHLREVGGHIGYIIRPTERGKGYGTMILREMIQKTKDMGIVDVLITCDEDNLPSRKVIEANQGQLEDIIDGICRYWIKN